MLYITQINFLVSLFIKYLSSTHPMPGMVPDAGDTGANKIKVPA